MNIHTPDSTPAAPQCRRNTLQEQQGEQEACVMEATDERSAVHLHVFDESDLQQHLTNKI